MSAKGQKRTVRAWITSSTRADLSPTSPYRAEHSFENIRGQGRRLLFCVLLLPSVYILPLSDEPLPLSVERANCPYAPATRIVAYMNFFATLSPDRTFASSLQLRSRPQQLRRKPQGSLCILSVSWVPPGPNGAKLTGAPIAIGQHVVFSTLLERESMNRVTVPVA
jgi:hypothetical protein